MSQTVALEVVHHSCHDSMAGRLSVQTLQLQIREGTAVNLHLFVMLLSGSQEETSVMRR